MDVFAYEEDEEGEGLLSASLDPLPLFSLGVSC